LFLGVCRPVGCRIGREFSVPVALKLFGQFADQRAVGGVAEHRDARGDRIGRHRCGDQDACRRSGDGVGQADLDSDFGCCAFAATYEVCDEIHFGESAFEPCVQAAAHRVVRREIGREHGVDESGAIVVEAFSQRGVTRLQDVDNALRRIREQIFGQPEQEAAVTGQFGARALGGGGRPTAVAPRQ
jgi:hypothetical protein